MQLAKPAQGSGQPKPIKAKFSLSNANVNIPQANDNIAPLFPDNVVIEFDQDTENTIKHFQAVHLGTVTVTITPTDTSYDPVTVDVTIQNPQSLGQSWNYYDQKIVTLANNRGIPPQYIKGQIQRESDPRHPFNPNSYRYEPLSSKIGDLYLFGPGPTGQDWREQPPYQDYRLAVNDGVPDVNSQPWPTPTPQPSPTPTRGKPTPTPTPTPNPAPQLPQGASLIPADVAPRTIYLMCAQGLITQGPAEDTCVGNKAIALPATDSPPQWVSLREIIDLNDAGTQNWYINASKATRNMLDANWNLLNFTAQTDLAASYGLLQIMYTTAISTMKWNGQGGKINPSYLFDTDSRIDAGTSSLPLGTGYDALVFPKANTSIDPDDPVFTTTDAFDHAFENAFNWYNHRGTNDLKQYGSQIVETFGPAFLPVPSAPIFSAN